MPNSYAFVLSKNTYPDAFQANLIGVDQGTRIVYAATDTLSSSSILYADSRLTQPIYGNPDLWLGVQLLTDDAVKYPIEISTSGSINIGTTTTTSAPTTTTTAAPTTTTTTSGTPVYTYYASIVDNFLSAQSCGDQFLGGVQTLYSSVSSISSLTSSTLYTNSGLTTPFVGSSSGFWFYVSTTNVGGPGGVAAQINASGFVSNQVAC